MSTWSLASSRFSSSPFAVLCREFFAQFFVSESATSDTQHRQSLIRAISILLPVGLFMTMFAFPDYEGVVVLRPRLIPEARLKLAIAFVTWSMVTNGYLAVVAWEGLTFERRDAMVLGPLPLRLSTVTAAKLTALAALVVSMSAVLSLTTGLPFAAVTANHLGTTEFLRAGTAHLMATNVAAIFVFASLVLLRGLMMLTGSPRLVSRLGSLLQFAFVALLLCIVLLPASVGHSRAAFLASEANRWNPIAWFVALFEHLHGTAEAGFAPLVARAWIGLAVAVVGAALISIVAVRHQMVRALAPAASTGALGKARISRLLARGLAGRDPIAHATSEFILLTVARNRAQQAPIATAAAFGLAATIITLASASRHVSFWTPRPTADMLAVPLLFAYSLTVGLRTAFFIPSELPAAWSFRTSAPAGTRAYWRATRAAMIAFVAPAILAITALQAIMLGWQAAAAHALFACAMLVLLVQAIVLTLDSIPFTRPYEPGHLKLRSRWPFYLIGLYVFAYWPAQLEVSLFATPERATAVAVVILALIATLEVAGRWRATRWSVEAPEDSADDATALISVLDIGLASPVLYGAARHDDR